MSDMFSSDAPRTVYGAAAAAGAAALRSARTSVVTDPTAIRPFHYTASEEALNDLRRRIDATKWPSQETVPDATQGVQLKTMQALAHYWQTDYDWHKCEAKLKAIPQFVTTIDGVDIHFIHVRSKISQRCH